MLSSKGTAITGGFTSKSDVTALPMLNNSTSCVVMFEEQVLCIVLSVDWVIIYTNSTHPETLNTSFIIGESSPQSDLLLTVCACLRADGNHVKRS